MSESGSEPNTDNNGNTPIGDVINATIGANAQHVIVGKDISVTTTVITEELAYKVEGLENPYLGLRAFTFADRAIYAGRERLAQEVVAFLTAPGCPRTILFIIGASGSGKSSFAQAAVLPLLKAHHKQYGRHVPKPAVFRPSTEPMISLQDALLMLHPSLTDPQKLATHTPENQTNLLVIDQFEEIFIQSETKQRAELFAFLSELPTFATIRTHILITIRIDYLDELFPIKPLWDIAKQGIELRVMNLDELRAAIQKPLQEKYPEKRFAPELLDRLVRDASGDATLLPLLQVTLAELWKRGSLTLGNYYNLTDAIRQRAEAVYGYIDHERSSPYQERSEPERVEFLRILLDLVNVAPDDTARRDVRQRRTRGELKMSSPQRERLIEELITARLLAASTEILGETLVERIDIIHESLIDNWDRLRQTIDEERQQLQRRTRFLLWLGLWRQNQDHDEYLLTSTQLTEAQTLVEQNDIELQDAVARDFYQRSLEHQEASQQAKAQSEAEAKVRQQWLQRLGVALAVVVIAAGVAIWQYFLAQAAADREIAQRQRAEIAATGEVQARVTAVAASLDAQQARTNAENLYRFLQADTLQKWSTQLRNETPILALLLGVEAWHLQDPRGEPHRTSAAENLVDLLGQIGGTPLVGHTGPVNDIVFSPDGKWLASASDDATIRLWSVADFGQEPIILQGHEAGISTLAFSPDGLLLASGGKDGVARLWKVRETGYPALTLYQDTDEINDVVFSPDGLHLVSVGMNGKVYMWQLDQLESPLLIIEADGPLYAAAFSPNQPWLVIAGQQLKLWNLDKLEDAPSLLLDETTMDVKFSPNGQWLAAKTAYESVNLWGIEQLKQLPGEIGLHASSVVAFAFAPTDSAFAIATSDRTIRLSDVDKLPYSQGMRSHQAEITALVYSSDGKWLASASLDHWVRIWGGDDILADPLWETLPNINNNPDPFIVTYCFTSTRRNACTNPGGSAGLGETCECKFYLIDIDFIDNLSCNRAGRNLTQQEWTEYFPNEPYQKTCPQWPGAADDQ